jgi:hypothetical protein
VARRTGCCISRLCEFRPRGPAGLDPPAGRTRGRQCDHCASLPKCTRWLEGGFVGARRGPNRVLQVRRVLCGSPALSAGCDLTLHGRLRHGSGHERVRRLCVRTLCVRTRSAVPARSRSRERRRPRRRATGTPHIRHQQPLASSTSISSTTRSIPSRLRHKPELLHAVLGSGVPVPQQLRKLDRQRRAHLQTRSSTHGRVRRATYGYAESMVVPASALKIPAELRA